MKVNRGAVVVGDGGAVLQCTVKDISICLGQNNGNSVSFN